jgi:hypothetical protein
LTFLQEEAPMKKHFASVLAAGFVCLSFSAQADEIPVNRVILSTSGLANFELKTHVDGNATVQFPVRLEQVDDILKSLVIFDAKGRLGGVTLPGRQPLAEAFKDLPFSQSQLASPMMLLNAYQGAMLTVKGAELSATGKILQVEAEQTQLKDGQTLIRHRISLMTAEGIRQAVLEDLQSIQFSDARPKEEIARALDAIRENGTSERRMLTINLLGDGGRDVALSYVVDAPLWKAAYRMVLPKENNGKGLLQGWAVIENMTASDWKNVDLTLVSGNPVTYKQALYPSYYVQRPEIPVQVFGRVMPRVDEGAVAAASPSTPDNDSKSINEDAVASSSGTMRIQPMQAPMVAKAPAPMPMDAPASKMEWVANAANAAQSAEATTQVLFRFPDRLSLKSGQSLMLPFISRATQMERISLYQPETSAEHPLAAVEILNDGESGLPPGILTLYEESPALKGTGFVGDAQLPVLGQGEKRMISYALDSKTTINRAETNTVVENRATVSQGILKVSTMNRAETVYTIKAPPKESRIVILEHPKMGDYKLVKPDPKGVQATDTHYRIRVSLKAGETKTIPVVLEYQSWASWGIDTLPTDQLLSYATSRGSLDAAGRAVFKELAGIRKEIDITDREIAELDRQQQVIFTDQNRIRENLQSLEGKSIIKDKYLAKLNEQEDKIVAIDKQKEKLSALRSQQVQALQKRIAEINF